MSSTCDKPVTLWSQVEKLQPVPTAVITVANILQVYPYLCYTLRVAPVNTIVETGSGK